MFYETKLQYYNQMDQSDISAILPAEGLDDQHYIQNSQFIARQTVEQSNENLTIVSTEFQNLFYNKRSMKMLLQQRSFVCDYLKLKLKAGSQKKLQPQISMDNMYLIVGQLFKECPLAFDPLHFVFIIDYGVAYGFFSGDGRYVPMCKRCNISSYVVLRNNNVKIVCCNPKCKIKILGETIIEANNKKQRKQGQKIKKQSTSKLESQQKITLKSQAEQKRRMLTKQQLSLIKKTAKKITYS